MNFYHQLILQEISKAKYQAVSKKIAKIIISKWRRENEGKEMPDGTEYNIQSESNFIMSLFEEIDPTKKGVYINWLTRIFIADDRYLSEADLFYREGDGYSHIKTPLRKLTEKLKKMDNGYQNISQHLKKINQISNGVENLLT